MIEKIFIALKTRPIDLIEAVVERAKFFLAKILNGIIPHKNRNVFLGKSCRIQSLFCLSAEKPQATIKLGDHCVVYEYARIRAYGQANINFGNGCIIGDAKIFSRCKITIGDYFITSWNVFIQDYDPHPTEADLRLSQMKKMVGESNVMSPWTPPSDEITIGDNVWVGANVTILRGAQIGSNCVVATGSVVKGGVYPPNSVLAGIPAKVVKVLA